MAAQTLDAAAFQPRTEDVIREIRYFRNRIRAACARGDQAGRTARDAYGPFLARRLKLLAALRAGRAAAWRDYPPAADPGSPRERGGPASR